METTTTASMTAKASVATGAHSDTRALPCRGCTANCKDYARCAGKPWRIPQQCLSQQENYTMRISTLDPISLNDVSDPDNAPFVIEGHGPNALKITFENEANKTVYLGTPLHTANATLAAACSNVADSDITGTII